MGQVIGRLRRGCNLGRKVLKLLENTPKIHHLRECPIQVKRKDSIPIYPNKLGFIVLEVKGGRCKGR